MIVKFMNMVLFGQNCMRKKLFLSVFPPILGVVPAGFWPGSLSHLKHYQRSKIIDSNKEKGEIPDPPSPRLWRDRLNDGMTLYKFGWPGELNHP